MSKITDFFDAAKMFYIATIEEDQPRVRPFGGLLDYQGKLYFNTNCTKKVFDQMMKNPKVELCAFNQGKWMRVEAKVERDENSEVKEAMLQAQPMVAKMYKDKQDIFEIFRLEDVKAILCSFGKEEEVL